MYNLAVSVGGGRGGFDPERFKTQLEAADEGGVHSVWSGESWGPSGVATVALAAAWTRRVQIGTAILNVYSRTPAAIAQDIGTLDIASGGRMILGLGTSGAQVVEHFHGVPFGQGLRRLREYMEIINTLFEGSPLNYEGEIFKLRRGFTLRFEPLRKHIPIYIASLTPASVRMTARRADGWLPIWIPIEHLSAEIGALRQTARAAGRDPEALIVRSPGSITLTKNPERARQATRGSVAFYVSRMGVYYYQNIGRMLGEGIVSPIKQAWDERGGGAAAELVSPELADAMSLATDSVEEARERLAQQQAAGVNLHQVTVEADSPREQAKLYEALAK